MRTHIFADTPLRSGLASYILASFTCLPAVVSQIDTALVLRLASSRAHARSLGSGACKAWNTAQPTDGSSQRAKVRCCRCFQRQRERDGKCPDGSLPTAHTALGLSRRRDHSVSHGLAASGAAPLPSVFNHIYHHTRPSDTQRQPSPAWKLRLAPRFVPCTTRLGTGPSHATPCHACHFFVDALCTAWRAARHLSQPVGPCSDSLHTQTPICDMRKGHSVRPGKTLSVRPLLHL